MAEAHPVGFQWVVEAKRRGAKIIHVDPRFTRTSALAHTYVPIRAGTDIAFLGGVVNYILSNELDFREYVLAYTNAATIVSEEFQDTEDLDGLFSGFDPDKRVYDQSSWAYAGQDQAPGHDDSHVQRETAGALRHESHGAPVPRHVERDETLKHPHWVDGIRHPGQKGFWGDAGAYATSLLKAYWGDAATPENDFCYGYLPRLTGDHGTYQQVLDMVDGRIAGYFLLGQNPAVGSAHARAQRLGIANLDWLVVRDLYLIESATVWQNSPEVATGEVVPQECRTEVFFLPAASHVEKEGTFTQTQRLLQWREKALDPPGDARSELWFFYHLGRIIREKLAGSSEPRDRAVLDLAWDYPTEGPLAEPSASTVLQEINGYEVASGRPLSSYTELKDDGSTVGGCWIYTGVYADGVNQAARRKPASEQSYVAPELGWAWPANPR